jgi:SAM-dependent methyltransferase
MDYGAGLRRRLTPARVASKFAIELRKVAAPVLIRTSPLHGRRFESWDGNELPYWCHRHNLTWRNERAVEIPVAMEFLRGHGTGRGMEFGNVLSHYGLRGGWDVVDRYEAADRVTNVDIVDFEPAAPFDFIVSLSTLEHVGWDEAPRDPDKVERAFARLRSLLTPDGAMLITAPLGYYPHLDALLVAGALPVERQMTLVRENGLWHRVEVVEPRPFDHRGGTGAGALWVGYARSSGNRPASVAPAEK